MSNLFSTRTSRRLRGVPGDFVTVACLAALLACASKSTPPLGGEPSLRPSSRAAELAHEAATAVTYENLYDREQYWPFHVQVARSWKPEAFLGDEFGYGVGVLVRVEPSGDLRVDFARFGKYVVPADQTDVLEVANQIRRGERSKTAPNFVKGVATKFMDPRAVPPVTVPPSALRGIAGYLVVAADPTAEDFPALAASLEPIRRRGDVMVMLLPQGEVSDRTILAELRDRGWPDPFSTALFTRAYTQSLMGEDPAVPGLLLQTPEGRVVHQGPWSREAVGELTEAIERWLGGAAVGATTSQRVP